MEAAPTKHAGNKLWIVSLSILGLILAIVIIVAIVIPPMSRKMIYQTKSVRPDGVTPMHFGMSYTSHTIHTHDGAALHSWWVPQVAESFGGSLISSTQHTSSIPTILFCHGNSGNMGHRTLAIKQFHEMGLNVFAFDYRGFGDSRGGGAPSEQGLQVDAISAYMFLTSKLGVKSEDIILVGRSLGGGVATNLAHYLLTEKSIKLRVILQSTFTSLHNVIYSITHVCLHPFVKLISDTYDNATKLEDLKTVPILVMHAVHDGVVPFKHGQKIGSVVTTAELHKPHPHHASRFVPLPRGGHNDCYIESKDIYKQSVFEFILTSK